MAVILLISIATYDWGHVVIITGLLAMCLISLSRYKIPAVFLLLFPLLSLVYLAASEDMLNLYYRIKYFDKFVHALTLFAVTYFAGYLLSLELAIVSRKTILTILIIISIGLSLGALWEIIEWLLTFLIPAPADYTAFDTATDLVADLLGASAAAVLCRQLFFKKN